jgi:chemotaxis signal transduction protein
MKVTPTTSPLHTDTFLPYMRDVTRCEQSLRELNQMWRMIESSAKMSCPQEAQTILPIMATTRAGFTRLEQELVTNLVGEKVANVLTAIGTKAQYVIDIVVRNLYERTADVGFLATDRELCAFVAGLNEDIDAVRHRLQAYRRKYTVYNEIMLLDTCGNVLVQIDPDSPVEGSTDPLIATTLASDSFVETFRATDLRPGKSQALIYSRRMHHPVTREVVGLLCLCFSFEEEMAGIFRAHRDPEERANMLLLDADQRVIASADPRWIAPGTTVPINPSGQPQLFIHAGREYLVRTFSTAGYQGYMGPSGWLGQVMIPVDLAFSGGTRDTLGHLDPNIANGLLSHARTFSPPLYEVMKATETIRRVVWNGQVITADRRNELHKLKTILEQISETGSRSNELFSQSIRDLYETVLESNLRTTEFMAQLLVDLLDRNLYERANDCRWWALTPELRSTLSLSEPSPAEIQHIHDILAYINSLYTVYARIVVYDRTGRILTSSCRSGSGELPPGAMIDPETLARVLALSDEQAYAVSDFAPSTLYDDKPTYIYHAAVCHPQGSSNVVGGIGIVFDANPEFEAMLHSALGTSASGPAFFINRQGYVLSSTDTGRPIGSHLDMPPEVLGLANGSSHSRIIVFDGHYAVLGSAASAGYREFKTSDGYTDDVLAVVLRKLGPVQDGNHLSHQSLAATIDPPPLADTGSAATLNTYATFFCGNSLLALPGTHVVEAVPASSLAVRASNGQQGCIGMLAPHRGGQVNHMVWVFDLGLLLGGEPSPMEASNQIVIVRHGPHTLGLLVSGLHGVPEFSNTQIMPSPFGGERYAISHFIKANGGRLLIQLLDVTRLFDLLLEKDRSDTPEKTPLPA